MNRLHSRTGSALLIVLGLLAFMIVSAVGFAAYMRFSRLPSSYLRRSVSTRHLAKAAMARAIDVIDRTVDNNPHPGVGDLSSAGDWRNEWCNRVFTGTNLLSNARSTVTPLCFEALAYVPPPLVNDLRYFSRRSASCVWQPLGFDSGRYVWTALDVSDYLDINRLVADAPRSSDPSRRVTLSHIFEDNHTSPAANAGAWDTFMERFRGKPNNETHKFDQIGKQRPLVSIADLNLAMYAQGGTVAGLTSPFATYYDSGTGAKGFYPGVGSNKDDKDGSLAGKFRSMTFVTDSLQPASTNAMTRTGKRINDLNDTRYQPFEMSTLANRDRQKISLASVIRGGSASVPLMPSDGQMFWGKSLSALGCATLFDYLDTDHVPISLAAPTTERVPMFCGVNLNLDGAKLAVARQWKFADGQGMPLPHGDQSPTAAASDVGTTRQARNVVYYRINSDALGQGLRNVRSLVCFPFAHKDDGDGAFTMDGRLSLFLTEGDVSLRTHVLDGNDPYGLKAREIKDDAFDTKTGLLNIPLAAKACPLPAKQSCAKQEDAVRPVDFQLSAKAGVLSALQAEGNELLRVEYVWDQTCVETPQGGGALPPLREWKPVWAAAESQKTVKIEKAHSGFHPGIWENKQFSKLDPDFENDTKLADFLAKGGKKKLDLRVSLVMRMLDDNKDVVDMVPACFNDDGIQNRVPKAQESGERLCRTTLGPANPLLLFRTGVAIDDFSIEGLDRQATEAPKEFQLEPKTAIVSDPRLNHAPEHWYEIADELTPKAWLDNCQVGTSGDGGRRAADIFMATSDVGYLQSPWEIAFLPALGSLNPNGGGQSNQWGDYQSLEDARFDRIPKSFGDTRNRNLAWRTYDIFSESVADAVEYDLPWTAEGTGYKINPYSDSTNVLMAAIANTPQNWRYASTNFLAATGQGSGTKQMTAKDFNQKYAFNGYAQDATCKFAWRDLERVAGKIGWSMRTSGNESLPTVWRKLAWRADDADAAQQNQVRFLGQTLTESNGLKLWEADRKFLYGFWRDCFAAKQQLFMVFVRAEPMLMGGGGGRDMPPQLGARAMALVWRDPTPSGSRASSGKDTTGRHAPHQTRVLFYRQFE